MFIPFYWSDSSQLGRYNLINFKKIELPFKTNKKYK